MEFTDQEQIRKYNQNYILEFLHITANIEDSLAESIKATITQFVQTIRKDVTVIAMATEGYIAKTDIFELQINSLRRCIVDLEQCLNRNSKGSLTIQ